MTAHLLDSGDLHASEESTQDGPPPGRPQEEAAEAQGPRGGLSGSPAARRRGRRASGGAGRPAPPLAGRDEALLAELVQAAGQLGVAVRVDAFDAPLPGAGAACLLRGQPLVVLDRGATPRQRLLALARALGPLGIETVWVTPAARDVVDGLRAPGRSVGGDQLRF